ncbi:MAG: 50S ribosomal protein L10 [Chloroflexia bacterium]|nr:50S ribosomal protein L10 [Chloroflexia bacterium]
MKKEDKSKIINIICEEVGNYKNFYLVDITSLNAVDTLNLRRKCFEREIKLMMVKNTLFRKALEQVNGTDYSEIYEVLKEGTSVMFTNTSNLPAKLIKELRVTKAKPVLKAAFVEESVYVGDNQLDALANLKSKEELVGDIIMLLQSPAKRVISSLQSGSSTIAGLVKTLSEKSE